MQRERRCGRCRHHSILEESFRDQEQQPDGSAVEEHVYEGKPRRIEAAELVATQISKGHERPVVVRRAFLESPDRRGKDLAEMMQIADVGILQHLPRVVVYDGVE